MIYKKIIIFLSLYFIFANTAVAGDEKFVTIVNPVRISKYSSDPVLSLKNEYSIIQKNDLSATWLVTYDVLDNTKMVEEIKKFDKKQEIGIFLEVTSNFSKKTNIKYNDTGSWHHANSLFLPGYIEGERRILIDKLFEKYKEMFGTYPKSIGSWWTDGYSLSYIKDKYGIVANLVCADQFSTDGYQIWGQPWQVPYYPSKNYPAVPTSNTENKLDLVNIQWAPRDPLNGYMSSLYSTQDYLVSENVLDINYFKKLLDLYLNTYDMGQVTVGLEADLDPVGYFGEFTKQMGIVKDYSNEGVNVLTMSQFYEKYKEKYPNISPNTFIKSKDLLGSDIEAYWYNSPFYRLHYTLDNGNNIISIDDIRIYQDNLIDPYFISPNYEFNLTINIPSLIDSIQNQDDVWVLPKDSEITTNEKSIVIKGKNIKIPKKIKNNPLVNLIIDKNKIEISFNKLTFNDVEGDIVKGFSSEAVHFFRAKKSIFKLLLGTGWEYFNKMNYLIPQGEIYALLYLQSLPSGRVMVYDNECLQCSWHTKNKPIVFANLRDYVKKYSNHPIIYNNSIISSSAYNSSVFNAKTIKDAKKEFKKVNAKYIYLVKFEEYIEKLPFSPGDLGIKKIYSNANAEVWEVAD